MASMIEVEFTATETPHAVYRLYDAEDRLLYVGFTWNIRARMELHAADKSWWPEVARRTMVWYGSERDARIAEAMAISMEKPLHNGVQPAIGSGVRERSPHDGYHKKPLLAARVDAELLAWARAEAKRRGQTFGDFIECLIVAERQRVAARLGVSIETGEQ